MIFKYIGKLEQEGFDESDSDGTVHVCNGVYWRKVIYAHTYVRAHTHTHTITHRVTPHPKQNATSKTN